ncbi:sigma-70 family RNA polymerase sigma factor [Sphingobacterium sp. 18053]|uniref:sigma-70 family RNA polymerase sigma factor n=1 Tax=Sphingobacterium sp. 18053 TaxID=2681401 RepID=UPI00135AD79B|nr:sigma-70 family RNA polymerase sigma factor [Sphingobacterium sp. 18053]
MNRENMFKQVFDLLFVPLSFYAQKIVGSVAEAEDLVEDVFLQCWQRSQIFEDTEHARFFLYRAVRNAALNVVKAKLRFEQKHYMAGMLQEKSEQSHLEYIIHTELISEIYSEIAMLPKQQRKVMLMSLEEGKKLQDIADELHLSLQTVKNCKSRAMARLRIQLSKENWLLILVLIELILSE